MIEMEEAWKPIKGYEGMYEISSFWRVRSLDRYDRRGTFHKGWLLKVKNQGYLSYMMDYMLDYVKMVLKKKEISDIS